MNSTIIKINKWRQRHIGSYLFLLILSVIIGFLSGLGAVIIKNAVHFIQALLHLNIFENFSNYLYFIFPMVGIGLTVLFVKLILRQRVGHGIPTILYSISKNKAFIKFHNTFSSIITSALTVGFGGSVGLEGPTVATGGAIGANLGKLVNLTYKQRSLLIGCASAAAMSAIFKSPIGGIVFALEVIMVDLTNKTVVPIILASASGSLTSFFFLGQNVLYPVTIETFFTMKDIPYYIFLGIFTGFIAVYFTRTYVFIDNKFNKINKTIYKFLIGVLILGILIYIFPALYGEGYESINSCLHGDYSYLFNNHIIQTFQDNIIVISLLFLVITMLKVIATSVTFSAGGIGGIFAPTLFMGANAGLFFATITNHFNITNISTNNSALVAMAGLIAAVLQAPLTGIFLIGDITHGYDLLMPLIITASVSYITVKIFEKNNVYSIQLAKKGELMTHHADKNALLRMNVKKLIETNFLKVKPNNTLGELVQIVAKSDRNIFPVVDNHDNFLGQISLSRIRKIMFKPKLYNKIIVRELMSIPETTVNMDENMESIANKIQISQMYNLVVLDNHKYLGYVSRSRVFSEYRSMLKEFSDD